MKEREGRMTLLAQFEYEMPCLYNSELDKSSKTTQDKR